MRLSKIKLSGFKSFVDPTTITFPGNLTGVVGPNGCGKSNVIDAIRWVLGESSAKTLRGDSMADVIFNGSSGRKPVSQASSELIFDNSDGSITGAYASYSEVSVRRVVNREGTSQYFLNNSRCRRKDITQLLLGTGLGSHGYSIIEQGMISRLVEAKPEELRAFLEEAAGISKYKERRRETEHRIRHTRENLERLADLRDEVEKHLGHLQRQAKAAERYKGLMAEQRRTTAELLALRIISLDHEVERQQQQLRESQLRLEAATTGQRQVEAEIDKLRVAQSDSADRFNEAQGTYYRLGAEIARLEQSIKHRKETIQRQREDLSATEQQLEEIQQHIVNDEVEIEQLEQALSTLNPDLDQAIEQQRAAESELDRAENSMERWREQWDLMARTSAGIDQAVQVEQTRLEQLAKQRERLDKEQDKHRAERDEMDIVVLEERLETLVSNEEQVRAACLEASRGLESVNEQIAKLREQERRLSERLDELRAKLQNDRGRLASLEALQEAAFGNVSQQVSDWLAAHSLSRSARLGEALVVDSGWERAVEMVLGNYLQAVTVNSLDALVQNLRELSNGGVSFVDSRTAGDADDAPSSLDSEWLSSRIRSPSSAAELVSGVRTAESLDAALAVREQLDGKESVVTRDGFWISRNWLRVSGRDDPRMGVISRGEEIERLRETIDTEGRRADDVHKALSDTRKRLEQLEGFRESTQKEANRRQQLYGDVKTRLSACRSSHTQLRERAAVLEKLIGDLDRERDELEAIEAQSRSKLTASAQQREQLDEERSQLEERRHRLQEELAEARFEAESRREAAQSIAIQVESRRSTRESASAALSRVQAQRQHLLRRQAELRSQIDSARTPLQSEQEALQTRLDEHSVAEKGLADARRAAEDVETKLRDAEQLRNERNDAVEVAREQADGLRLDLREVQVRLETLHEQFRETGFELSVVREEIPEEALVDDWLQKLERIDRRVQRLGSINLAAIDEFEEQSERKAYLDRQYTDLTEALETLENAIRKIDRETRAKFRATFEEANKGLGRLFPRLFGGGHAYLELDSDDLLSSGVSIMARPPGKRISTIHLLSGGEKALTAVALVFSIFELNPAPFCLLDEVDAPLDEANVGRFSDIVREMSERVQFVIITHNKTTIESMGQLAGVTMNEPGVSRMVAVDIEEAVQLAAM
jgi:chromosome segregation protein